MMRKTKSEESKELDDHVSAFLKNGGKIEHVDTTVSKLKDQKLSNQFFAKTHYLVVNNPKKR